MEQETNTSDRLAEMLNSPQNYTEEQWRDFLSTPEGRDAFRLYRLAQKAMARQEMAQPDADEAWQKFSAMQTHRGKRLKRAMAWAVSAAAAVVVGWFAIHQYIDTPLTHSTTVSPQGVVAFAKPQDAGEVTLASPQTDAKVRSLGKVDSVSFLPTNRKDQAVRAGVQTISIPSGQDCKVMLPDGSEVFLNAGSQLTFPTKFSETHRTVSLVGEACFKVKHNDRQPFVVHTEKMLIRDLGTEFIVQNYPGKSPSVVLIEGAVAVSASSHSSSHLLRPGEGATLDGRDSITTAPADIYAATQWMNGYFYFTDSSLMEVLTALARWYDKGILIRNKEHLETLIHFSAERNDSLSAALENLNQIQQAQLRVDGDYIVVE